MRIAVIGVGGTGGYFGGLLARAGEDVTFVARGAQLEALRTRDLTVQSRLAGTFTVSVRATDDPSEAGPVDLVLFCVKAYDTEAAAEGARPLFRPGTMLISLQNGIDNEERIARAAGHSSGLGAAAYVVSAIKSPGVVEQTAGPGKIVLGELGGGKSERTDRLRDALQRAGIAAEAHPDIRAVLWQKLLFICAFSGVTAVTRLPIGIVLADPVTRELFRGTSEEVEAVARRRYRPARRLRGAGHDPSGRRRAVGARLALRRPRRRASLGVGKPERRGGAPRTRTRRLDAAELRRLRRAAALP
jgi:2-dehydropantoate 2-reductase